METIPAQGIPKDRDHFLRELIAELATILETTIGLKKAQGFIALVGTRMGEAMDRDYRQIAGVAQLSPEQVADALVDLKRRIQGGFSIESIDSERIILVNDNCPFGDRVKGKPSLCMMTSNVFGRIAADNLGYARVALPETIASGDRGCRVIVELTGDGDGIEYFG